MSTQHHLITEKWAAFQAEILRICYEYDRRVYLMSTDPAGANPDARNTFELAIRLEQNKELTEALVRHKRELEWIAGYSVAAVQHNAAATVFPVSGQAS